MRLNLFTWFFVPVVGLLFITNYFMQGIRADNVLGKQKLNDNTYEKNLQDDHTGKSFEKTGKGIVTLWFDDAWDSQYDIGYTLMQKKNIKGSLAVPISAVGTKGYMGWWHIQKLQFKGWEINSHTRSHECESEKISPQNLMYELLGSKVDLESKNIFPENFVAPCGTITDETTDMVKKYYKSQRTSEAGLNKIPVTNPYLIKAYVLNNTTTIDEVMSLMINARDTDRWLVLVFHKLDTTQDKYSISPALFEQIINEITTLGIQTALPYEVLSI